MNKEHYLNLVKKINEWNFQYFTNDILLFDESIRDQLKKELIEIENQNPSWIVENSPSQNIGSALSEKFTKFKHKTRKYSLSDAFDIDEIKDFIKRAQKIIDTKDFLQLSVEPKIDGLNVTLWYKKGQFYKALTRGDGKVGEDITHTISTIKTLPKVLPNKIDLEVTGEVCIKKVDFDKINQNSDIKYANPRNLASGSVRQIDPTVARQRNLHFFAYAVGSLDSIEVKSQESLIKFLKLNNFEVQSQLEICSSIDDLKNVIAQFTENRDSFEYEIDGLAIKINDLSFHKILGHTVKCPRFALAYKFPAIQKVTKVLDIKIQIGRTGALTPVAILEPVLVDGSIVQKATLHNQDEIDKKDIRIGDTVVIQKAGDIIPEVVSVIKDFRIKDLKKYQIPKLCPSCQHVVTFVEGQSVIRCENQNCPAKKISAFKHFVSKKGMNIEGLAVKTIETLIENQKIYSVADIYNLQSKDLMELEGFKDKKINNILSSIERSKNISLPNFLFSLNILHLGEKVALDLSQFLNSIKIVESPKILIELLEKMDAETLENVEGFGGVITESISSWFQDKKNLDQLMDLHNCGIRFLQDQKIQNQNFKDKSVVITGSFEDYKRDDLKKLLSLMGAKVQSSVSSKTDILICGLKPGSKFEKASKLGVKIIDEKQLSQLLS
jgi:DNA ligase (NAD+)